MYQFVLTKNGETVANGGMNADTAVSMLVLFMNRSSAERGDVQAVEDKPVATPVPLVPAKVRSNEKPIDGDSTSGKVRRCLLKGMRASEVASECGTSRAFVYQVKAKMKRMGELDVTEDDGEVTLAHGQKVSSQKIGREAFNAVKKLQDDLGYTSLEAANTSGVSLSIVNKIFQSGDFESFDDAHQ